MTTTTAILAVQSALLVTVVPTTQAAKDKIEIAIVDKIVFYRMRRMIKIFVVVRMGLIICPCFLAKMCEVMSPTTVGNAETTVATETIPLDHSIVVLEVV